ncbi:MAG: hypothetical protein MK135_10125 [Polyangiaceae bacterium]|nr:hypothetical protein [Polyangiaceae bacterium]
MKPKFISSIALIGLSAAALPAVAQVSGGSGTLVQLEGNAGFQFYNTFPEPITEIRIDSTSNNITPDRTSFALTDLSSSTGGTYDLALLTGSVDVPVNHDLTATAKFDGGRDIYHFRQQGTPTETPNVFADTPLANIDFLECSSNVTVRFVSDAAETPEDVEYVIVKSYSDTAPPTQVYNGSWQAYTSKSNTSQEAFPVAGDNRFHKIEIDFNYQGIRFNQERFINVGCASDHDIVIRLDELPLPDRDGVVIGELDLVGENEDANSYMYANSGPFAASGSDTVIPGFGAWVIENLIASDYDGGSVPYTFFSQMDFLNAWGQQYFRTPDYSAPVSGTETTDLGDTFVMTRSQITGQVNLTTTERCAAQLVGQNSTIRLRSEGTGGVSARGAAQQTISPVATLDGVNSSIDGAYGLSIGVPNDETGTWRHSFYSNSYDQSTLDLRNYYKLKTTAAQSLEIPAGTVKHVPVNHCVIDVQAEIAINEDTDTGTTFRAPVMDFETLDSSQGYTVTGQAKGTPRSSDAPGTFGLVPGCIPAGAYEFDTRVTATSPDGVESFPQLRVENADLPCGAIVRPFYVVLGSEACPNNDYDELPFDLDIISLGGGGRAARAWAEVNGGVGMGGLTFDLCGGTEAACPDEPEFEMPFSVDTTTLAQCGNTVEIFVLAESGELSESSPLDFAYEKIEPSGPGCNDVQLTLGGNATASFNIDATADQLNECGIGENTPPLCTLHDSDWNRTLIEEVADGQTLELAAGTYQGQCHVDTACGYRTCSWTTTVTE